MRLFPPLLLALAPAAAEAEEPLPTVTAEQALAALEEQFRRARAGACRTGTDPEEVVVCAERPEDSPYRIAASTRVHGYAPTASGPLFELNLGPVRVGCCAIATGNGSGAGLSLGIRF